MAEEWQGSKKGHLKVLYGTFPVNIQTTLIYNTSITFLCHIFYFLFILLLFILLPYFLSFFPLIYMYVL